jgi:hypothetical protein
MIWLRFLAPALLGATAIAAENPATGKWNCTNQPEAGSQTRWTLLLRESGNKLAGTLSDGDIELPLSEIQRAGDALTFRFYINTKPYAFEGRIAGRALQGKYSGDEAKGQLRCEKPTT